MTTIGHFRAFLLYSGYRRYGCRTELVAKRFESWLRKANHITSGEKLTTEEMSSILYEWGKPDFIEQSPEERYDTWHLIETYVCDRCGGYREDSICTLCGAKFNKNERRPRVRGDKQTSALTDFF
jgi:hypothetical protein